MIQAIGFPPDTLSGIAEIHIYGRQELWVEGCSRILVYEREEIRLSLDKGVLTVLGEGLSLKTYFSKRVALSGRIDSISFSGEGV